MFVEGHRGLIGKALTLTLMEVVELDAKGINAEEVSVCGTRGGGSNPLWLRQCLAARLCSAPLLPALLRLCLGLRACLSFFSGKDLLMIINTIIVINIVNYGIYSCLACSCKIPDVL